MRRIVLIAAIFFAAVTNLWAQGAGQIPAWAVLGNPSAAASNSRSAALTTMFDGAFCSTANAMLARVGGAWVCQSTLPTALLPAGIDANVLNAQTANYSLATTDCGKTITLGGSAFFTLTVGAASGFNATCSVVIANIDTGRGKRINVSGLTFPNNSTLRPLQSFILKNENNVWTAVSLPGRWKLSSTVNLYVDAAAGSNTNDGLAAGAGGAFADIGQALTEVCSYLDLNFQSVVVNVAAGTYPGVASCSFIGYNGANAYSQVIIAATYNVVSIPVASPCVVTLNSHGRAANDIVYFKTTGTLPTGIAGGGAVRVAAAGLTANTFQLIDGAGAAINCTGSPSGTQTMVATKDTKISGTAPGTAVAGVGVFNTQTPQGMDWRGFQFINCTTQCFYLDSGGVANLEDSELTACTCIQLQAILGGRLRYGGLAVSGGASYFMQAATEGSMFSTARPILFVNTPVFAGQTVFADRTGNLEFIGATFVGTGATGQRFLAQLGGGINTGGAGATFIPGNVAGSAPNPGWYN